MLAYIIRLDDACPEMNLDKWIRVEGILDQYQIRPIVGIIPDSFDKSFNWPEHSDFWTETAARYVKKGWTIAQHGCHHFYQEHTKSEFTGLCYEKQEALIRKGYEIMRSKGIIPTCFFAPAHSFDAITIDVCRDTGYFAFISDGMALFPYQYRDMLFVPVMFGAPHAIFPVGVFTFCLHPNTMGDHQFARLEAFIAKHKEKFFDVGHILNITDKNRKKNIIDLAFSGGLKLKRKIIR